MDVSLTYFKECEFVWNALMQQAKALSYVSLSLTNVMTPLTRLCRSDPAFTERTRMPHCMYISATPNYGGLRSLAPMNLELVKGLFRLHLTELHKQIVNKENMYQ